MKSIIKKHILIKVPYIFIWTLAGIMMFFGSTVSWWSENITDTLFWVIVVSYMPMAAYVFYLFFKYYNKKALKEILIHEDEDIVFIYQIFRQRNPDIREYTVRRRNVKIMIKRNAINLLYNGKSIAKIYRNTLKNKNDWEWLIYYFGNVSA